jgi:bis(5'-nucleosyl)-tetraphosphatase (symmetrical)
MATWAIGDVQGCHEPLTRLMERVRYRRGADRLCFVGDLVNRGPDSLGVLRVAMAEDSLAVLGNHDLYALARAFDLVPPTSDDTLSALWTAPDRDALIGWLLARPVLLEVSGALVVHAGLLPRWSATEATAEARLVERYLAADPKSFLARYFQRPKTPWSPELSGAERAVAALGVFVRIRFVDSLGQPVPGASAPERPPVPGARPWFLSGAPRDRRVVFGHWAALGLWVDERVAGLDSGCVWGGSLTAMNLENRDIFAVGIKT